MILCYTARYYDFTLCCIARGQNGFTLDQTVKFWSRTAGWNFAIKYFGKFETDIANILGR
jgi:hypothetical protein